MEELKKQLNIFAQSDETYKKITEIGDRYDLMIDYQGELAAATQDVIEGFASAKDFVKTLENRLEVDSEKANKIAQDVSKEIFEAIRDKLMLIQEQREKDLAKTQEQPAKKPIINTQTISAIEQAGDFKVENSNTSKSSYVYSENINKDDLLKKIEDTPITLTDHLLSSPVISPAVTETKKIDNTPVQQSKIVPENKVRTSDPYREPII